MVRVPYYPNKVNVDIVEIVKHSFDLLNQEVAFLVGIQSELHAKQKLEML